ncbi:MAG TPA: hypothetical protein VE871_20430 [Longimicrobium sp.]|nr:hypothetical protein [Longimicrobium sp.]
MRLSLPIVLVLAGCTPAVHHREVARPVPLDGDPYACAVREVERMGYRVDPVNAPTQLTATRARPQADGARYATYDYLAVDVLGTGTARVLRVGAVTLAGGNDGVHPHFRPPVARTEADRDAVLDACAGRPATS